MERRWSGRAAETIWKQHGLNDTGFRPIVQHENEDGDSGQNEPSPALPPSLKLCEQVGGQVGRPLPHPLPNPHPPSGHPLPSDGRGFLPSTLDLRLSAASPYLD